MARPAESYRGARRNAWRTQRRAVRVGMPKPPWQATTGMAPPRYVPYRCKPPRLRFGTFQAGPLPNPMLDVMVPYTDLRKQPKVYR